MRNKATTSLDLACQLDSEFFKANLDKSEYRRKALPGEVPRKLRKLRIREVLVHQIADGIRLRGFVNASGAVVAQGMDFDHQLISSRTGMEAVNLVLRAVGETFPIATSGKKEFRP
jgi:hypothetical protein